MTRRVTIDTPLGDELHFRELHGQEKISELFFLDVEMLSESATIDPKSLLGRNATIVMETRDGTPRYLDGIVTRFCMQGEDHRHYAYKARLSPWLWLATRKSDFRIFQNKTVPEIIEQVLDIYGYPLQKKLTRSYRNWDYCVQYNESDFAFVSRLMEHEGIYYYFEHGQGRHTLMLCDDIVASHRALPGGESIPFYPPEKLAVGDQENIHAWQLAQEIKSGRHCNDDFDFRKPRADLGHMRQDAPGHAHDGYEVYEWPGGYTEWSDGLEYARIRLQQSLTGHSHVRGQSCHRALATGYTFNLHNYPRDDQNQQYLLTGLQYHFKENPRVSVIAPAAPGTPAQEGSFQRFVLQAQPTSLPFTPERVSPRPRTTGPQTATVVGPAGEEIWTDEYGRIKVQFHWDRLGTMDENSSCWIRVATGWAGPQFGSVYIPRIGHEVVVDFLNGDPDYPLVTGCVYNAANMPPWALPANATQSGIKTRSSKGGASGAGLKDGQGDANALRFEDKAGAEQLWLHAQKDQLTEVENDEDKWVGNDRRKTIDRDETSHIKRDRTETVDRNERIDVHGWRTEVVDLDETITVHHNRRERVDLNERISIGVHRTEDVGRDEKIDIGNNRRKVVGRSETDKIARNWSIHTGRIKTETTGIANLDNVGVARMSNVGVAYSLNVGLLMNTLVGMNQSEQVGLNQSITVGGDHSLEVGKNSTTTVGDRSETRAANVLIQRSGDHLELSCGAAKIVLKADGGIYLQGAHIEMLASTAINMDSAGIDINVGKAQTPPQPPEQPPATSPGFPGLGALMEGLGDMSDGIKGALGAVQQLQGLAQTAQAIKNGDLGAVTGLAAAALGGGGSAGAAAGAKAGAAGTAMPGMTPGFNPGSRS